MSDKSNRSEVKSGEGVLRTLILDTFDVIQLSKIDTVEHTFRMDCFIVLRLVGGAKDDFLRAEGIQFPTDAATGKPLFRPSAGWYLKQLEVYNSSDVKQIDQSTNVRVDGDDLLLCTRFRGDFLQVMELREYPFDTQNLTVVMACNCRVDGPLPVWFAVSETRAKEPVHLSEEGAAYVEQSYAVEWIRHGEAMSEGRCDGLVRASRHTKERTPATLKPDLKYQATAGPVHAEAAGNVTHIKRIRARWQLRRKSNLHPTRILDRIPQPRGEENLSSPQCSGAWDDVIAVSIRVGGVGTISRWIDIRRVDLTNSKGPDDVVLSIGKHFCKHVLITQAEGAVLLIHTSHVDLQDYRETSKERDNRRESNVGDAAAPPLWHLSEMGRATRMVFTAGLLRRYEHP